MYTCDVLCCVYVCCLLEHLHFPVEMNKVYLILTCCLPVSVYQSLFTFSGLGQLLVPSVVDVIKGGGGTL